MNCVYLPLGDGYGLKVYGYMGERNYAYRVQRMLHRKGIAPAVNGCFNLSVQDFSKELLGKGRWELWDLLDYKVCTKNNKPAHCHKVYCYVTQEAQYSGKISQREAKPVYIILNKCGLNTDDIRDDNCGRINGKLVVIDCCKESLGDPHWSPRRQWQENHG